MKRERDGVAAAKVPLTAATVQRRITIQHLLPETLLWHANTVVLADHRRKVTNEEHGRGRISTAPKKADDAPLIIAAVDPRETAAIKIQLVQRTLAAI